MVWFKVIRGEDDVQLSFSTRRSELSWREEARCFSAVCDGPCAWRQASKSIRLFWRHASTDRKSCEKCYHGRGECKLRRTPAAWQPADSQPFMVPGLRPLLYMTLSYNVKCMCWRDRWREEWQMGKWPSVVCCLQCGGNKLRGTQNIQSAAILSRYYI